MQKNRAIKIALLISFIGHLLLLGMPGINILSPRDKQPEDTPEDTVVRLEIERPQLLPKIAAMGEEKKLKRIEEIVKEEKPPTPEAEEVAEVTADRPEPPREIAEEVDAREEAIPRRREMEKRKIQEPKKYSQEIVEAVDPQDEAILRYRDMVKRKIQESRRYPLWAKKQGYEGVSYLAFTVLPGGTARDIRVVRSSGFEILDKEAVSTVKRASPFKPIPEKLDRPSLAMELALVFRIE